MPEFHDSAEAQAPPEEVWKLLYDPSRFPEWWAGIETVDEARSDNGDVTFYPDGYPDFPMPQQLETSRTERRVTISCLVSYLRFEWQLEPSGADATRITVHVEIPEEESHRLDGQREAVRASLGNLARLAAA